MAIPTPLRSVPLWAASLVLAVLLSNGVDRALAEPSDACASALHNATVETTSEHCQAVVLGCGRVNAMVPYLEIVTCRLPWLPLLLTVAGLMVLMAYYLLLLATTADKYFIPPLMVLSEKLRLSPSIAGCTLLALGNGAPDVFTAYAALNEQSDVNMLVCGMLGASVFTTSVCLGAVLWVSSNIPKDKIHPIVPHYFLRDTFVYAIGLSITAQFMKSKSEMSLSESLTLLLVYGTYLFLVICSNYFFVRVEFPQHRGTRSGSLLFQLDDTQTLTQTDMDDPSLSAHTPSHLPLALRLRRAMALTKQKLANLWPKRISILRKSEPGRSSFGDYMRYADDSWADDENEMEEYRPTEPQVSGRGHAYESLVSDDSFDHGVESNADHGVEIEGDKEKSETVPEQETLVVKAAGTHIDLGSIDGHLVIEGSNGEAVDLDVMATEEDLNAPDNVQRSCCGRCFDILYELHNDELPERTKRRYIPIMILFWLEMPFTLIRSFCIPPSHMKMTTLQRMRIVLSPYGMTVLAVLSFAGPHAFTKTVFGTRFPLMALLGIVALVISFIMAFFTRHNRQPSGVFEVFLAFLAFIASIAFISLVSRELVALLTSLALILQLSTSILSLTLLAVGNTLGDTVANISLAKRGNIAMATSAIFGGPIFHDIAGTAISFAGACIDNHRAGGKWVVAFNADGHTRLTFIFLLTSVVSTICFVTVSRFRPSRYFAFYLVLLYAVFVVMCVLIELDIVHV